MCNSLRFQIIFQVRAIISMVIIYPKRQKKKNEKRTSNILNFLPKRPNLGFVTFVSSEKLQAYRNAVIKSFNLAYAWIFMVIEIQICQFKSKHFEFSVKTCRFKVMQKKCLTNQSNLNWKSQTSNLEKSFSSVVSYIIHIL